MNDEATTRQKITGLGWRALRRARRRLLPQQGGIVDSRLSKDQLLPVEGDSILTALAPGILRLGEEMQRDDRPIVVGPWLSELGFEILYWIPFVKWFAERFSIAPERLVFVSRGGMASWYDRSDWQGAATYRDIFSAIDPDAYRKMNAGRWQRSGNQKQMEPDPAETGLLKQVAGDVGIGAHHVLHPAVMYNFFVVFWTHGRRLGLGVDLVLKHAIHEPLPAVPAWTGPELPSSFVAVKFYERPSLPHSPETAAQIRDLMLRIAERRTVVSLDTSFRADEHDGFAPPDHPNIVSARDWMTPENNLDIQTRLIAASDFFIGTYGGTAYIPPFVGKASLGVHTTDDINLSHQFLAMNVGRKLGRDVTLMHLRDCCHLVDIVAGKQ